MEAQENVVDKKLSLQWYMHKRFIIIGFIMGILMIINSTIIIRLAFMVQKAYQQNGDSSHNWVSVAGLIYGFVIIAIIVIVDMILNKMVMSIIHKIKVPLEDISQSIMDLSQGNLDTEITYNVRDEFASIADHTTVTIAELKNYISNISEILTQLSHKNMNVSVDIEYVGDFVPIQESIETIIDSLNSILSGMQESMGGIRVGAENMADTAASLAKGATTQSCEIQDLVTHINQITKDISINAEDAESVAALAKDSLIVVEEGNNQMRQLLDAMEIIKKQSDDISNIIQVINSISTQTQLLSLNASIEAARAGEQGKGFAVVADEIGKLASECGEAADTTNELISKTIEAVNAGGVLADETAGILKKVVDTTAETSKLVNRISTACSKEEGDLNIILHGVENIESVVSNNAAASEESAAVSEELLALVESLEGQLEEYRLRA